jgi:hypothetical protein
MPTASKRVPITSRAPIHSKKKDVHAFPQFSSEMTDEQLRLSVEVVLRALLDDAPWERRVSALYSLNEALQVSSTIARRAVFLTVFGSSLLKQSIISQLQDLRSGVVRAACEFVAKCSASCIGDAEKVRCTCEGYTAVLLSLCVSSAHVVAAAADAAVMSLLATGVVTRPLLQCIFASCRSRSPPMRDRAFRYVCVMLCCGDRQVLLKQMDALLEVVREGVTDAAETSRKFARASFWALHSMDDVRCMQMLESLPDTAQLRMDQDKETFESMRREHQTRGVLATVVAAAPLAAPPAAPISEEAPRTPRRVATPTKAHTKAAEQSTSKLRLPSTMTPRGRAAPPSQGAAGVPVESSQQWQLSVEKWNLSQDQLQSTEWSARVTGLSTIASWLRHMPPPTVTDLGHRSSITKAQAAELTRVLPYRIDDPHYRVSVVALEVLDGLLANAPMAVLNELPHILSAVFAATQGKDVVRNAAQEELEVIASVFDVDVLLAPLYRVVDVANQQIKVKQACFEFLLFLIQKQPKLLTPTLIRSTLAKLMQLHARETRKPKSGASVGIGTKPMAAGFETSGVPVTTGPLADAIAACIAALYQIHEEGFVRAVLLLPPSEQETLFVTIDALVPHLKSDVRRSAAGERVLPHPAVSIQSPFLKERGERSPAAVAARMRQAHSPLSSAPTHPKQRVVSTELSFSEGLSTVERPARASRPDAKDSLHYDPLNFSATAHHHTDVFHRDNVSSPSHTAGKGRNDARLTPEAVSARITRTLQRQPPDVLVLLRTSNDTESRRSSLVLASVAVTERQDVWKEHFCEVMALVMSLSSDGDHSVRVAACRCMIEVVSKCEALVPLCVQVLSMLIQCALICMEDPFPEVQREASVLFHVICAGGFFGVNDVVRALLQFVNSRAACTSSFVQALEEIGNVMWRHVEHHPDERGALASQSWISAKVLDAVISALVRLFQHELSEVRKAVVGVLVHVWASVEERVLELLRPLSISQRKLVSIYFHRHAVDNRLVLPGSAQRDLGAEIDLRCTAEA